MEYKLSDIAEFQMGLLVDRKKTQEIDNKIFQYKTVTLKSFTNSGHFEADDFDKICFKEEIPTKYLTKKGNVIIRLSSPYSAVTVNEEGVVIPSLCVKMNILRKDLVLPEYLTIILNSVKIRKYIDRMNVGSVIKTVRASDLKNIVIKLVSIEEQEKVISYWNASNKKLKLLDKLVSEEKKLQSGILKKIL